MSGLEARLTELKRLLDKGLIGDEDFERQKRALLAAAVHGPLDGETRVERSAPERIGSYRVLSELGRGGMGTVLRARHLEEGWATRQGGDVAIKLIHPHIAEDASFRERFFAEAELGRKVSHTSIATVFDVITDGEHLGTVMALVEGRDLKTFVRPGGLPVPEVVALLRPLAEALDHLHAAGIIHRDLKPANVKVRDDGTPVILDLGIAKDLNRTDGETATSTALGSVGWMAPEQADAKRVGPEADRYAFGAIAYALLAGRMPWKDELSEARILSHKLRGVLVPLNKAASCSNEVSDAVMRMLSLTPSERFPSCVAFVDALVTPARPAPKPAPKPAPPAKLEMNEATVVFLQQSLPDLKVKRQKTLFLPSKIVVVQNWFCGAWVTLDKNGNAIVKGTLYNTWIYYPGVLLMFNLDNPLLGIVWLIGCGGFHFAMSTKYSALEDRVRAVLAAR